MFPKTGSLFLLLGIGLSTSQAAASSLTVQTTSGLVQGKLASGTTSQVAEYLGIPYVSECPTHQILRRSTDSPQAQPPVGQLRWAPPARFNGTGSIDATNFVSISNLVFNSCVFRTHSQTGI
jgi:carboxylesterase type B